MCRAELQKEVQDREKLQRGARLVDLERRQEIDSRRRRWRRSAEELGERLNLVARLNLLHVLDVGWIEKLRAIEYEGELRLTTNHRVDARRRLTMPTRACEQVAAGGVAGGAAADVS